MRSVAVLAVLLAACPGPQAQPTTPQPAVHTQPQPPAQAPADPGGSPPALRLPKNFVPTGYAAKLAIDPGQPTFTGEIQITATVSETSPIVWLHGRGLTIQQASAAMDGTTAVIAVTPRGDDLLELRATPPLAPGTWTVTLAYTGTFATNETAGAFKQTVGGATYVQTQLEALFARRVFPCVDEPDSKVPWQLTIDAPAGNAVVSNTPIDKVSVLPDGKKSWQFLRTKPLPSYLVAFGVGPFDVVDGGASKRGTKVQIITLKGRGAEAAYAAQVTARILDLAEEWFAIPYPYEKLDVMTIPLTVGFQAMENAGLITCGERYMLFDPKQPSWGDREHYAQIMAHEVSHQWFGDYVTMTWWDDLWLNEGFATWVGGKLAAKLEPAWRGELGELDTRIVALDADGIVSARRVRQPITEADQINNAFDGITYSKGASVLNMFEAFVGRDVFQRGVRDYLNARAWGNATSNDFVSAISAAAGRDLTAAFSSFLDQPGAPEIEATLACSKGSPRVELAQRRFVAPGSPEPAAGTPWHVPVCVVFEQGGKRAEKCTLLTETTGSLALDTKTCPRWVMANAHGRGHYRARYTAKQATALRDEAWPSLSWTERRALYFDVTQATRYRPRGGKQDGKLPVALALSLVPRMLASGDRFTVSDLSNTAVVLERLAADDQRAKLEGWLRMTFGPGATKVGLLPKPGDDIDAEGLRLDLVKAAVWIGHEPELVKQAIDLAQNWRQLPSAMRGMILTIASEASPELHAKLMREVKTEPERARRDEMFGALAAVRDPKRVEAALELLLDPAIDFRESSNMLVLMSIDATRAVAERFVRANLPKLLARMPKDSVTGASYVLVGVFTSACDGARRDEIASYLKKELSSLAGGKGAIEQGLEQMDNCIAGKQLLAPELRAWLSGVKLPKPAKP